MTPVARTSYRSGPRLTVGVPVYNGEAYLGETLESLLGQTFEDFELVISDNASTDGTPEIAAALGDDLIGLLRGLSPAGLIGFLSGVIGAIGSVTRLAGG